MNSYNTVYNRGKKEAKAEQLALYESQRIDLVNAIKKEYGITDFSSITEGERKAFRKMVSEMWSKENGLTKDGEAFIAEGKRPLNESSSPEKVQAEYKRGVKKILDNKFSSSPLFNDSDAHNLAELKSEIEKKVGSKLAVKDCREWFYEIMCAYVGKNLGKAFKK